MKVAIHHIEKSFSERWISYCQEHNVSYRLVNLLDNDILLDLKKGAFTHVMCQVPNEDSRLIFALLGVFQAANNMGIKTFPSLEERWHFDNKIYQKYLLEGIDAPFINTEVFYNKQAALSYCAQSNYPIVAKLKRGAGSVNVQLLKSRNDADAYINKMFTTGISPTPKTFDNLKDKVNYSRKFKNPIEFVQKGLRYAQRIKNERNIVENEKGYVLLQEFLPNNSYDTRIVIANDIAFGLVRLNRENDFRASGSGHIIYDHEKIDLKMIEIAFQTSKKLNATIMAYDFLKDELGQPRIVECCYAFTANSYDDCDGYWDEKLNFYKGPFQPHKRMIKHFLEH